MMEKSEDGVTEAPPPRKEETEGLEEKKEKELEKDREEKEGKEEKEAPSPTQEDPGSPTSPDPEQSEKEKEKEREERGSVDSPLEPSAENSSPTDPQKPPKANMVGMRRESFTQMLRNSWKDSLNLRKDKLKVDKRQGSISNLNSLPPSPSTDGEPKDKSGSLSRRIGKVVISGVNKLRGKNKDPNDSKESDGSDQESEEEGNGQEFDGENQGAEPQPNGVETPVSPTAPAEDVKRIASLPNLSAASPVPPSPRRNSDPPAPLPSILRSGPRESADQHGNVKFNEIVTVRRTWAKKDYDRKGEVTWKLTPEKAIEIRNELNEFKREMDIHEESRCNTHFY